MKVNGFAIQSGYTGKELIAISSYCHLNKVPYVIIKDGTVDGFVHVGSVEFILSILNKNIEPDYYPSFLKDHLYRKLVKFDKEYGLDENIVDGDHFYIKPADKYKRFDAMRVKKGILKTIPIGPYWVSEDLGEFENEWRYYVSNGKILCGEWYNGDGMNTPEAPTLDINDIIPKDYCGSLDFGRIDNKMILIEAHHPFACGWYGKNHKLYVEWLVNGWNFIKSI